MHHRPLLPRTALPLDDIHNLIRDPLREHAASTASALLLARRIEDPHYSLASALFQTQRHGDRKRDTTTSRTLLLADAHQRRERVDGEGEVEDWIERELGGWWRAGEEGAGRRRCWWRSCAEMVEDEGHMLVKPDG